MNFEVEPLPYPKNALAHKNMSEETLKYHYENHHKGYMIKLKKAIDGTPDQGKELTELVSDSKGKPYFNNAAQVWNHTFFWKSMSPQGGGAPSGDIADLIKRHFQSFENFKEQWTHKAVSRFGSGWAWLVIDENGDLKIKTTGNADNPLTRNADNPLTDGMIPILTLDIWEHSYYIDYRYNRQAFVQNWTEELINWNFVNENLSNIKKAI